MKIVVLDGFTLNPGDLSWDGLRELGELTVYERTPGDQIVARAAGASIVLTNKTPLRKDTIQRLPDLRYIGILATGCDCVDYEFARTRGIPVCNAAGYSTASTAQFTMALLLELCQHVGLHSNSARGGEWSANPDFCYWKTPLVELDGKTIGIVGFGRIGRRVAAIARALGMRIATTSRVAGEVRRDGADVVYPSLDELLRVSDVVSLHCPLTASTRGMINRDRLKLMKRTALLVNTGRGPLIVENDLAQALAEGTIAGAAVDVLSSEPPDRYNSLLHAPNCIVTPHIAWATAESRRRLLEIVVGNVRAFQAGSPTNLVNP